MVAQCNEPGASVAKVALAHGINANVVHRWRQLAREGKADAPKTGEFIALALIVGSLHVQSAVLVEPCNRACLDWSSRSLEDVSQVPAQVFRCWPLMNRLGTFQWHAMVAQFAVRGLLILLS